MRKRIFLAGCMVWLMAVTKAQEIYLFSEGTDTSFYDQGIVDVASLGGSSFEYTSPPAAPQYNDKVPVSTNAFRGTTSLKLNYTSAANGNWKITIYRNDWSGVSISEMDSISFFIYSENGMPSSALPLIALRAARLGGTGDVNSTLYSLSDHNKDIPAKEWSQVVFPLRIFFENSQNSHLDFSDVKGIIFNQSEKNGTSRLVFIDEIKMFRELEHVPVVENFSATGYDSHVELRWEFPMNNLSFRIYASFDGGLSFSERAETTSNHYFDFVPAEAKNSSVSYRITTLFQGSESEPKEATAVLKDFPDEELLDMIQKYTFRYFWEGAHQKTGMALERSNGSNSTVASGATGMGLMAMIVAHEREYRPREEIKERILLILEFLDKCERHHGAWAHWYNAETAMTQPFSTDDDGGDIVESSFVAAGLIALKNYFSGLDEKSVRIRQTSDRLWREVDWNWYRNGQNVLIWHWSPVIGFQKNMHVRGWNEALITYIMAASSPTYGIPADAYDQGWAGNGSMVKKRSFYGYEISLAPNWGGPLFWLHYTHLGINPHGLKDKYADYWQEHVNTALIHNAYAVENPFGHKNYSIKNWGLTASDDPAGYTAHQPRINDNGTISPTAALSSMPFTPELSMKALKYFYQERGRELFGIYGTYDAFNDNFGWVQKAYIGIDQGPIVVMIENYRTGLIWNAVMNDADVQAGLDKLGFVYQVSTGVANIKIPGGLKLYPNPAKNIVYMNLPPIFGNKSFQVNCYRMDGSLVATQKLYPASSDHYFYCSGLGEGVYLVQVTDNDIFLQARLVIKK